MTDEFSFLKIWFDKNMSKPLDKTNERDYLKIINTMVFSGRFRHLVFCLEQAQIMNDCFYKRIIPRLDALSIRVSDDIENYTHKDELPLFDDYIKVSTDKLKLTYGSSEIIAFCSSTLTITFQFADECSIFVKSKDRFKGLTVLTMNELDLMLTFICFALQINQINFVTPRNVIIDSYNQSLNIFEKMLECSQSNENIYNEQLVRLSTTTTSLLSRWGRYATYFISLLNMIISDHIRRKFMYNNHLLCITLQHKLKLISDIKLITSGNAFGIQGKWQRRQIFHLVVRIPHAPIANINEFTADPNIHLNDEELKTRWLIKSLPVELRYKILNDNRNTEYSDCCCSLISCKSNIHTKFCQSRDNLIDPSINLLFPISSRTIENRFGGKFTELYIVLTILPKNAQMFDNLRYNDFSSSVTTLVTQSRVFSRMHFQGNVLNMNDPTFNDLAILKSDVSFTNHIGNGLFHEVKNNFYEPDNSFKNIQISCSHSNEFIPKLSNAEPHYLLFD